MSDGRTETDFVHALIPKICASGVAVVWRNNAGTAIVGRRAILVGTPGMSDILGVCRGASPDGGRARFISYEIKSRTAPWTQGQRDWLALVRDLGGVACEYRYSKKLSWDENLETAVATLVAACAKGESDGQRTDLAGDPL